MTVSLREAFVNGYLCALDVVRGPLTDDDVQACKDDVATAFARFMLVHTANDSPEIPLTPDEERYLAESTPVYQDRVILDIMKIDDRMAAERLRSTP